MLRVNLLEVVKIREGGDRHDDKLENLDRLIHHLTQGSWDLMVDLWEPLEADHRVEEV